VSGRNGEPATPRPQPKDERESRISEKANAALQRLAKWRSVFAGWQLGTRAKGDPECGAVRDHREVTILLRAEVNALTRCCIEAGVFDAAKFTEVLGEEAEALSKMYEAKFPGMKADDSGIVYDLPLAAETMKGWLP
jgi:hypothetical protein